MNYCLYHANCVDGFTAAWAVWLKNRDWDFIPVQYGQEPPELPNAETVAIVDFSYPPEILDAIAEDADYVLVLDHHASAERDLATYQNDKVEVRFDMKRSGAMIAWEEFHAEPAPELVRYVQDRDIWVWELPESKAVSAFIRLTSHTFEAWNHLNTIFQDDNLFRGAIAAGKAILVHQDQQIKRIRSGARVVEVGGFYVPSVNSSVYQSELGDVMAVGHLFALVWYIAADGKVRHSLRSRAASPVDVSVVAKLYGGGGHPTAAGFVTSVEDSPVFK